MIGHRRQLLVDRLILAGCLGRDNHLLAFNSYRDQPDFQLDGLPVLHRDGNLFLLVSDVRGTERIRARRHVPDGILSVDIGRRAKAGLDEHNVRPGQRIFCLGVLDNPFDVCRSPRAPGKQGVLT